MGAPSGALFQIIPQPFGPAGMAELAEGFCLDLADALPRDVELLPQLFQRAGPAVVEAEAERDHPLFAGRQTLEHAHQLLAEQLAARFIHRDPGFFILNEIFEVGVFFLAHRRFQADRLLCQLQQFPHPVRLHL